jgi:hypothetical protein
MMNVESKRKVIYQRVIHVYDMNETFVKPIQANILHLIQNYFQI